jgi:WD40 repeat protein
MQRTTSRRLSLAMALLAAACVFPRNDGRTEAPKPRTDIHGDPLPDGAVARYGSLRLRHAVAVTGVAFSPDGKLLVSVADEDKSVRVWDVTAGKLVTRVAVSKDSTPETAAFGRDGTLYLVGEAPACVAWDLKKGRRVFTKEVEDIGTAAVCSPDGKTLALGLDSGKTLLLDAATGAEKAALEPAAADEDAVTHLEFTPDGTKLAVGHGDGMVRLWDVAGKKRLHTFPSEKGAEGVVQGVSVAPDGRSVLVTTDDRAVRFDVETGKAGTVFQVETVKLSSARFTPDGKQVVGLGTDGRVFRWDAESGKQASATKKALFDDADGLAVIDAAAAVAASLRETDIHLIDLRTGKLLHRPDGPRTPLLQVRFTGKGEVVCRGEDGSLRFWDAATGRGRTVLKVFGADDPPPATIDLSPDGKRLATVDDAGKLRVLEGKKELWKAETTEEAVPSLLRFSPDGAWLAACHVGGVLILDAATGKRRHALVVESGDEFEVQWSPDGRMLAVAVAGRDEVTVWEVGTGRKRQTLEAREAHALAFSADGRRLAVGSGAGLLRVFETGTDRAALELGLGESKVQALAFSPDGSRLAATGGDAVRLWDREGKPLGVFRGHEGEVHDLAFAPDGRTLVTAGHDGTALVWDVHNPPRPARPRDPAEPKALWQDLGDDDGVLAFRAVAALRDRPAEAVAFLKEKLTPVKGPEPKRVERLLSDLDSDDFDTREKAAKDLEALDVQAEAALRAALARATGADLKRALRMLIEKLETPPSHPDRLREMRAVEVLEQIGNAEARAILTGLAGGDDARLTREAKAALRRLNGAGER